MKMLKFQKLPDSRRNHYVAASLLLLGICLEISTLSKLVVAVDIAVEEVAYSDSPSTTDEKGMTINDIGNGEDKQDETNSAAASKTESIIEEGEENNIHLMPSSIATATLVGARLRESADIIASQDPSHHRINNDNKHHNSNNIVNSNINDIGMNFLHWAELPTPMKEAASTLGCTSQMWDNHEESPQCELFWSELTPEDQRAAMVLGYQSSSWGSDDDDDDVDDNEDVSASVDIIEDERNPNPNHVTDRCHWGAMGCNKGGTSWNSNAGSTAASSKINSTPEGGVDGDDGDIIGLHQSSLAGSATAKIEAHVMKGAIQSTLSSKKDGFQSKGGLDLTPTNPPQGFLLAARIVTSPHDGLSYFLDVPEANIKMMMTIPYTFVECGRNIESSTESFPLEDMVVRHLPAGADIGHWVNLGGGVTVDPDEEDDKGSSPRYINGNHDGRPKLLVALSPIEILVSGNEEESRTFNPGEIILMEDTLGKGHKMRANSRGKDLSVIMISLPHTVHYPAAVVDWSSMTEEEQTESSTFDSHVDGAHQSLFGFAQKHRRSRSKARHTTKPCPLEYDSAYSSLFTPTSHIKMSKATPSDEKDTFKKSQLCSSNRLFRRLQLPSTSGVLNL